MFVTAKMSLLPRAKDDSSLANLVAEEKTTLLLHKKLGQKGFQIVKCDFLKLKHFLGNINCKISKGMAPHWILSRPTGLVKLLEGS
jgi:hypothetical protein